MKSFILLFSVVSIVASSPAYVYKRQAPPAAAGGSECPQPKTLSKFDSQRYFGDWYQAEGIPTFFQPSGTRCVRATYGNKGDGTISVRNIAVKTDGKFTDICGFAVAPNATCPASLQVTFPFSPPGSYKLLDTDYDNFASVYSCSNVPNIGKFEYAWILTRQRNPAKEVVERSRQAFIQQGISVAKFEVIDQGETCFYQSPDGASCDKQQPPAKTA